MQIGSAATNSLSTQALLPASLRVTGTAASAPSTSSSSSSSSPDTTVTLSAAGSRLAAADKNDATASPTSANPNGTDKTGTDETSATDNSAQAQLDRQTIAELASRDIDVRAHEQAHASVGGAYAGSPSFTLQRGPNGKSYAVGGEVGIDISAVSGDPAATISKMEVVMRAALAPIDPSAQDLRVAAQAQGLASAARSELAQQRRDEAAAAVEKRQQENKANAPATDGARNGDVSASLQLYQSVASPLDTTPQVIAIA